MEDEPGWHLNVDPGSAGWRLDRFLAARIPRLSRARAARLEVIDLDAPDAAPLRKSARVRSGQRLFARRPMPDADAELASPRVLYEDGRVLVLDKPPGLATHPTASRYRRTVTHWLAGREHGEEPAHRLDVETSGVLVCGRTPNAVRALRGAFAERAPVKTYWAVVEGVPERDSWTIDTPLGFALGSAVRIKMGPGDLAARTTVRVLHRGVGRAVVEARPETGRQHQIRAHLGLCGHPLVGDKLYGPDEGLFLASLDRPLEPDELARLGHHRQALHARRLELPGFGDWAAPWPADLRGLLPDFEPR